MRFSSIIKKSTIARSVGVLSKSERRKISLVVVLQIFLGLLDLVGVAIVGALASLAVSGVGAKQPGNRVTAALNFFGLEGQTLQSQSMILGISAALILISKTAISIFLYVKLCIF